MTEMTETKRKAVDTTVKAMEGGERRVKVIASTATEDRVGDVVRAEGISLDRYKQNPVVLWNHDQNFPVARCPEIGVENGKLVATVDFPPEGTTAKSDEVYRMVKAGVINAVSIGFKPTDAERYGDNGYDFKSSELLEFSFVSVPANPDALIVERSLAGKEQIALMRKNLKSVEKQTKFLTFDEALNGNDWYEEYYERHWALLESWHSISEDENLSDTGRKQAMRASFDDFVDSVLAMMGDAGGDSTNPNEPQYTPDPSEISMMSTPCDVAKRLMRLRALNLRSAHTNTLNGV